MSVFAGSASQSGVGFIGYNFAVKTAGGGPVRFTPRTSTGYSAMEIVSGGFSFYVKAQATTAGSTIAPNPSVAVLEGGMVVYSSGVVSMNHPGNANAFQIQCIAPTTLAIKFNAGAPVLTLDQDGHLATPGIVAAGGAVAIAPQNGPIGEGGELHLADPTGGNYWIIDNNTQILRLFRAGTVYMSIDPVGAGTTDMHGYVRLVDAGNYSNDSQAGIGGVPLFGIYRNGSDLRIRMS
jgi:hypothetical protein